MSHRWCDYVPRRASGGGAAVWGGRAGTAASPGPCSARASPGWRPRRTGRHRPPISAGWRTGSARGVWGRAETAGPAAGWFGCPSRWEPPNWWPSPKRVTPALVIITRLVLSVALPLDKTALPSILQSPPSYQTLPCCLRSLNMSRKPIKSSVSTLDTRFDVADYTGYNDSIELSDLFPSHFPPPTPSPSNTYTLVSTSAIQPFMQRSLPAPSLSTGIKCPWHGPCLTPRQLPNTSLEIYIVFFFFVVVDDLFLGLLIGCWYLEHVGCDVLDRVVGQIEVGQFRAVEEGGAGEAMQVVTGQRQRLQVGAEAGQVGARQGFHLVVGQVEEAQSFQMVEGAGVFAQMVAVQIQEHQRWRQRLERQLVDGS